MRIGLSTIRTSFRGLQQTSNQLLFNRASSQLSRLTFLNNNNAPSSYTSFTAQRSFSSSSAQSKIPSLSSYIDRLKVNFFDGKKSNNNSNKNDNNNDNNENDNDPNKNEDNKLKMMLLTLGAFGVLMIFLTSDTINMLALTSTTWEEFVQKYLSNNQVAKLDVSGNFVTAILKNGTRVHFRIGNMSYFEQQLKAVQEELGVAKEDFIPITYSNRYSNIGSHIATIVPFAAFILYFWYMRKSGGNNIFKIITKSKSQRFVKQDKVNVSFADVAGLPEAKQEIMEFVDFLKNPAKYKELGARIPKGALLVGPPGTGKTLLAKATAGESSVPFFNTAGSDFIEMFVGVGPNRVRELFAQARAAAPCIVFIDEIDAIGRARSSTRHGGANDERESTLNQILVEMDGFNTHTGVVVLAGTNRVDMLDHALLRPGRFDRQINIDNPDLKSREEIFLVHLKPITICDPPIQIASRLAQLTPGFSGADIANVCNEAALIAARGDAAHVRLPHFEAAIERVIGGLEKKNKVMSPLERKTVAYHEAGHAIVSWFLEHTSPLLKVSIIPRGTAGLGYSQYLKKDQYILTQEQMLDSMCMALGGRCAETLMFDSVSTSGKDDLEKVTNMAYSQVRLYGMNAKVGPLSFPQRNDYAINPFGEELSQTIDEEVRRIVKIAYDRTFELLQNHKPLLEKTAELLLDKESINGDDLEKILGPRPYPKENNPAAPSIISPGPPAQVISPDPDTPVA
eukprot:TRINITY_DN3288_c0_g1_i1.p1 TRINITY_DN3288_c0_g1~~TRINITY_DN3288_c0_g1_i1.p1  ORF type:complete len:738 (-),score=193.74 TRINITY_DN3288_c0_g1_i1:49-2262(-)